MKVLEGQSLPGGRRFAVVASRFYDDVTRRLVDGCVKTLGRHGVKDGAITLAWVPGAFEIPLAARTLAATGEYAAVVCLGAVIRGETSHYDVVCREAAAGIAAASLETGVPCLLGVLTTDTVEQALHRSGPQSGNKGADAALAALEMADLLPRLSAARKRRRGR
jgi:6,7-dimethyl-8-ribityllumazine synthase